MKTRTWLSILVLSPLILGTTYIVRQNGVEVGRYEEDDGIQKVLAVNRTMPHRLPKRKTQTKRPHKEELGGLAGSGLSAVEEKRRAYRWGIMNGMSRAQVEAIASDHDVARYRKYTEQLVSKAEIDQAKSTLAWVFEYRFESGRFKHVKKVYFDYRWRVYKVVNSSLPIPD